MKRSIRLAVAALSLAVASSSALAADTLIRLKERVPLERLASDVLDPASPRFGKFYTPEEIRQLSGPDEREFGSLIHDLENRGFTIVNVDKTKLFITVRAPVQMKIGLFSGSVSNLIESVSLDSGRKSRPLYKTFDGVHTDAATTPTQIRTVYGFNPIYSAGLTGRGQHIAIATYDGFNISDTAAYFSRINLSPQPTVDVVSFNGVAPINNESAVETEVDVEFSGQLAPGAQIHVFASNANSDLGEVQLFTAILDDNRAKVANYSWGDCERNVSAQHRADMDRVFARAIAQGVNIFVASGDSGALGCANSPDIVADWPAAHPNVVAVGGTKLNIQNDQPNEVGWTESGGGISQLFNLPTWQSQIGSAYVRRSFPDVSFNADPQTGQAAWVRYHRSASDPYTEMWLTIGGTSIASPQWAGFLTLVNEARGSHGALGFVNPIFYSMSAQDRQSSFHDVTQGNNHGFNAGPGWDAVTGWGSMNAAPLLHYLVSTP